MAKKRVVRPGVSVGQMATRICERDDMLYDKKVIVNVLNAYMEECRKALLKGESIQLSKIGKIIPQVKVHERDVNIWWLNKEGGNPPYVSMKITRNEELRKDFASMLIGNIKKGIMGLEKLPFSNQQLRILKEHGFVPEDVQIDDDEEAEGEDD
jgi:hypothetical protein